MTWRIKSCVSELGENTVPKRDQIKAWLQWVDFPMDREIPRATKESLTTKGPEWHMISSNKQRERRGSLPPSQQYLRPQCLQIVPWDKGKGRNMKRILGLISNVDPNHNIQL